MAQSVVVRKLEHVEYDRNEAQEWIQEISATLLKECQVEFKHMPFKFIGEKARFLF